MYKDNKKKYLINTVLTSNNLKVFRYEKKFIIIYFHLSKKKYWSIFLSFILQNKTLKPIGYSYIKKEKGTFLLNKFISLDKYILLENRNNKKSIECYLRSSYIYLFNKKTSLDLIILYLNMQINLKSSIFLILLIFHEKNNIIKSDLRGALFSLIFHIKKIKKLFRLLFFYNIPLCDFSEPFNLLLYIKKKSRFSFSILSKILYSKCLSTIKYIKKSYINISIKSVNHSINRILSDKHLTSYIFDASNQTKISKIRLIKKVKIYYNEMVALLNLDIIWMIDNLLELMWNRIYDGLFWEKKDIDLLRRISPKGFLIILPSHKSHIDYLIMSQVLYRNNLNLPYVAAGSNLNFFPLGMILRRSGAYFIKRSYKSKPLYNKLLYSYLKNLCIDGVNQEFFIEGGRSRTGKILIPKYGLLRTLIKILDKEHINNAIFVPASISYEKLIEEKNYRIEIEGGVKKKENIKSLWDITKIIKKNYGQVFVSFDRPIYLNDVFKEFNFYFVKEEDSKFREFIKKFAYKIIYGINRCLIITGISLIVTAILGTKNRVMTKRLLKKSIQKMISYISNVSDFSARFAPGLMFDLNYQIDRSIRLLLSDKFISINTIDKDIYYKIYDKSILSIEYYKNNIIHYFVQDSMISTSFVALGGKNKNYILKKKLFIFGRVLYQVLKYEFIYSVRSLNLLNFNCRILYFIKKNIFEEKYGYIKLNKKSKQASMLLYFSITIIAHFIDTYLIVLQKIKYYELMILEKSELTLRLLNMIKKNYINGFIIYYESINKFTVQNMVNFLIDIDIISVRNENLILKKYRDRKKYLKILTILQLSHYNRLLMLN